MNRRQLLSARQLAVAGLFICLLSLTACTSRIAGYQAAYGSQAEVIQAQEQRSRRVEITVEAQVYKLLADDTEGIPHQRFLLKLANGTTVLVAHDTNMAQRVPLEPGSLVRIHGEYIWNAKGGVIHWTHHTDTVRHEGGWIDFNGQRYQ